MAKMADIGVHKQGIDRVADNWVINENWSEFLKVFARKSNFKKRREVKKHAYFVGKSGKYWSGSFLRNQRDESGNAWQISSQLDIIFK